MCAEERGSMLNAAPKLCDALCFRIKSKSRTRQDRVSKADRYGDTPGSTHLGAALLAKKILPDRALFNTTCCKGC